MSFKWPREEEPLSLGLPLANWPAGTGWSVALSQTLEASAGRWPAWLLGENHPLASESG